MASLTLTVPDEQAQRVVDAFAAEGVNTPAEIKQHLIDYIKGYVFRYEKNQAIQAAIDTAEQNFQSSAQVDVS